MHKYRLRKSNSQTHLKIQLRVYQYLATGTVNCSFGSTSLAIFEYLFSSSHTSTFEELTKLLNMNAFRYLLSSHEVLLPNQETNFRILLQKLGRNRVVLPKQSVFCSVIQKSAEQQKLITLGNKVGISTFCNSSCKTILQKTYLYIYIRIHVISEYGWWEIANEFAWLWFVISKRIMQGIC